MDAHPFSTTGRSASAGRSARGSLALGCGAGALYLLTLSGDYTGDALEYALGAEAGPLPAGVEAHAVLLAPLARLTYLAARALDPAMRALEPIAALNALAGAIAVGLVYLALQRATGRPRAAALAAAGLAVSNATWLLAVSAEMVTPALALAVWALSGLVAGREGRFDDARWAGGLGARTALAALALQSNLLLLPAALAAWWRAGALARRSGRAALAWCVGGAVAGWGVPYALVQALIFGLRGPADLRLGLLHPGLGLLYGRPALGDLPHGLYAAVRSVAGWPGLGLSDSTRALLGPGGALGDAGGRAWFVLYYVICCVALGALVALAWRRRAALAARHGPAVGALAAWCVLNALFAVWWEAGDLSFWLPVITGAWLLVGLALAAPAPAADAALEGGTGARAPSATRAAAALVGALAAINGLGLAVPNALADTRTPAGHAVAGARLDARAVAAALTGLAGPADVAIVIDDDVLLTHVAYAMHGRAISAFALAPGHALSPLPAGAAPLAPEEIARRTDAIVARTAAAGGRTFLVGRATAAADTWARLAPAKVVPDTYARLSRQTRMALRGTPVLESVAP